MAIFFNLIFNFVTLMNSKRQQQNARMLQKEIGLLFQFDLPEITSSAFITIADVKVTPDLKQAKIYLRFLNVKDTDKLLDLIQKRSWQIRKALAQKIRNQVKYIPELMFHLDQTLEDAEKMEQMFKNLNIPLSDGSKEVI